MTVIQIHVSLEALNHLFRYKHGWKRARPRPDPKNFLKMFRKVFLRWLLSISWGNNCLWVFQRKNFSVIYYIVVINLHVKFTTSLKLYKTGISLRNFWNFSSNSQKFIKVFLCFSTLMSKWSKAPDINSATYD